MTVGFLIVERGKIIQCCVFLNSAMIAIPKLKKRKLASVRVLDGILFTLNVAAITFGLIAPRLTPDDVPPPVSELVSDSGGISLDMEEISLGPLLDTIGSEQFQQRQIEWAEAKALEELAAAREKADFIISEAANSATATTQQAEILAEATALKANYAVASLQLHRPPGHEYRTQVTTIIKTTKTRIGCDVLLTQFDDPTNKALMTGLATGSCSANGIYPAGHLIGKQGTNAVGKRIY